jgi:hypothetical protein
LAVLSDSDRRWEVQTAAALLAGGIASLPERSLFIR